LHKKAAQVPGAIVTTLNYSIILRMSIHSYCLGHNILQRQ
jgi:hypothetical protein